MVTNSDLRGCMRKHFKIDSLAIILTTLVLFVIALFVKGITHDLLLEAGIFLVSVKLIIMAYKNSVASEKITKELHAIREMLRKCSEDKEGD